MPEPTENAPQPPATPPPLQGVKRPASQDLLEPGEQVLTVIRRSIIGLLGIYLVAIVAVAAIFTLAVVLSPDTFNTSDQDVSPALSTMMALGATLLVLILFTATYVYRQSRLMITDRSLVQILQKTLFIRKVSRLSMSNVEDVNEEQRGILANVFNYGTLTVQTAGTEDNFIFTLCPNPAGLADRIVEARQAYAKLHPNEK
ncbi:MAG TPA: PH domain-containing protein [Candidatus Saccharimonadales bacterium]|nr:PH domain-containing protein [Candidatus Saccharimonadales bacterium]